MTILEEFNGILRELLGSDDRPVVVFSSAWPFFRAIGLADHRIVDELVQVVMDAVGERSLLMPVFSGGYREGVCDLDVMPSTTGAISEAFRLRQGSIRTLSAFFSFAVQGPAVNEVADLMPLDAWGDGSVYHWMELNNARFLMLGTDPTHCSYLHRIEWLLRDEITYRYVKTFNGILLRDKKYIKCREQLFVRSLNPEANNDFTVLKSVLNAAGMVTTSVQGIPISLYDSHQILCSVLPVMKKDPLYTVINKNDFKRI